MNGISSETRPGQQSPAMRRRSAPGRFVARAVDFGCRSPRFVRSTPCRAPRMGQSGRLEDPDQAARIV